QIVHLPGGARGVDGAGGGSPAGGAGAGLPAANDGDIATLRPYTVYSTGHQPAIALDSAADQQPHHDYKTTTRDGPRPEVPELDRKREGEAQAGQPIPAPIGGEVMRAGPDGGAGNAVMIRGDAGEIVALFHLSSIDVKVGQRIDYWQVLGNQGSTGNSTGPHVHIEAPAEVIDRWVNDRLDGTYDGRHG